METKQFDFEDFENINLYQEASSGKRISNHIIDQIIICIILFLCLFLIGYLGINIIENDLFIYLILFIISFIYFFTLESTTGKTIGKYITKTKVLTLEARKPSASTIAVRTLCRLIPFDSLSFLFSSGWHDSLSKTKVVEIK